MCNCKGKCGCNITQITKGEKGDNGVDGANGENGTNGTNAYKFVKQIVTTASEEVTIPYSEITSCNSIPEGCYAVGTSSNAYIDLHVQIFKFVSKDGLIFWEDETNILSWYIDNTNGNLVIRFSLENAGTHRVVILA